MMTKTKISSPAIVLPFLILVRQRSCSISRARRLFELVTYARHRGSGALAGHTLVTVDAESPQLAHQDDTSVVRAHRGHRLGLLLKAGMMLWLAEAEPQIVSIDTGNSESNDHMILVNDRLGYRAMGRELSFQRKP